MSTDPRKPGSVRFEDLWNAPAAAPQPSPATAQPTPNAPRPGSVSFDSLWHGAGAPGATAPADSFGHKALGVASAALGQGVAAGYGDEIVGGVAGAYDALTKGVPFPDAYRTRRDAVRAFDKDFAQQHHGLAVGSELVGGLAGALIPFGGAEARALSTGAKVLRGAGVGAMYGAVGGLGKGEGDAVSQAKSTATGALLGGVLGGAFERAGSALGGVRKVLTAPASERAMRHVATAVDRSADLAPHEEGMTLADMLGTPGQRLLDYTVLTPSEGGSEAAAYLNGRATTRGARLQGAVEQAVGTGRGDVAAADRALVAQRAADARVNYGAAKPESVPVRVFGRFFNVEGPNPFQAAYEHGRASASIEGVRVPTWEQIAEGLTSPDGQGAQHVPVQALDYMKRGIDKLAERGGNSKYAIDRTDAHHMAQALDELLAQTDPLTPMYAKARRTYAGQSELIDALASGQTALGQKPGAITHAIAELSPAAQQRYRQGIAEQVGSTITGRDVLGTTSLRALSAPERLDRLAAAATDAPAALGLRRTVAAEGRMQPTEALALRQSATTPRNQVIKDVEGADLRELAEPVKAGLSLFSGNPLPALQYAAQRGYGRYVKGINERVANDMAPLLLAGRDGPQDVAAVLQVLRQFAANRKVPAPSTAFAGRLGGRYGGDAVRALLSGSADGSPR